MFAHLGLEYTAALKASSEAYVAKSKEDRKKKANRHTYSIEEYGLSKASVNAAFAKATRQEAKAEGGFFSKLFRGKTS